MNLLPALLMALLFGQTLPEPAPAQPQKEGKIAVAVTMPFLADLVREVGGDQVSVIVIGRAGQDPHTLRPTPQQIVAMKNVELFVENGMQLESSWSLGLVESAKNAAIAPGKPGHLYATNHLFAIEKPTQAEIDAGGHVHAAGNPHIWLDPINLAVMARNVENTLRTLRKDSGALFAKNRKAFIDRLNVAIFGADLVKLLGGGRLEKMHRRRSLMQTLKSKKYKGKPLSQRAGGLYARALKLGPLKVLSYHKTWSYFADAFGFEVIATVESKPGIAPSPAHLKKIEKLAKAQGARIVISPPYYPQRNVEGAARRIGGVFRILPTQPGESAGAKDLISMFTTIFDGLESAAKETKPATKTVGSLRAGSASR